VIDLGSDQIIQWCNKKTSSEFGMEYVDRPVTHLIPENEWTNIYSILLEHGKIEKSRIEIDNKIYEISASYMKIFKEGIIQLTLKDITREVRLSSRDHLTDLYNRRKFEEIILKEVERARRYTHPLSVVMFDIDHFKHVNDTYGHQCGDYVLRSTADLISKSMRKVDFFARYGGEEFIILAPGVDLKGAQKFAEKLRKKMEGHIFEKASKVTISIGVAEFVSSDNRESLIERADSAMYRAKNNGRNRVEI